MTTYILAGGNDRKSADYAKQLRVEVEQVKRGPLHVLDCLFATPREDWEAAFAPRLAWFQTTFGPDTTVDFAFPDRFEHQLEAADVLYIEGGDDALLGHYLNAVPDVAQKFAGKVIIGSSAGANWLAKAYWRCDWRDAAGRGSGLVDRNIMVHYGSAYGSDDPRGPIDWARAKVEFQQQVGADEPVTLLHEGELVVVDI